jgi:hypothetical protein
MVAFVMIVLGEFVKGVPKRALANEDHLIQARLLDRPHEAFRVCVEIGRTGRLPLAIDPVPREVHAAVPNCSVESG